MRAYAKYLGLLAPTLSGILAGKRPLPAAAAAKVVDKLGFSPAEQKRFLTSVYYRKADPGIEKAAVLRDEAKVLDDEVHFKLIAEWEHYAILTLAETADFKPEAAWIAKRFNITEARSRAALERLKSSGLLSVELTGRCRVHQINVKTTEDITSNALRHSHRETLEMAIGKLETVPLAQRDFSSTTIAVSMARMNEAKSMIRSFRKQLSELLEDGGKSEVYQLCVQLYPLTQIADKITGEIPENQKKVTEI